MAVAVAVAAARASEGGIAPPVIVEGWVLVVPDELFLTMFKATLLEMDGVALIPLTAGEVPKMPKSRWGWREERRRRRVTRRWLICMSTDFTCGQETTYEEQGNDEAENGKSCKTA